jgi:transcriptional regulator with XRE-family HTH domain
MPKNSIRLGAVAEAALAHFSTILRVRRKEKRITLNELADRLGVTAPTVRRLLDGSPGVAIGTYFEAAYVLGIPLFNPERRRFEADAGRVQEMDALLPMRVRPKKIVIDDDF